MAQVTRRHEPRHMSINHSRHSARPMKPTHLFAVAIFIIGTTACQPTTEQQKAAYAPTSLSTAITPVPYQQNKRAKSDSCIKTLFSCKTRSGKKVLVCDAGKTLHYSFGKPDQKPELFLSVPRGNARTSQWRGLGRWIYYSVTIPNGNTSYSVFTSLDRMSDSHEFDAGLSVTVGDEEIARIDCMEPIVHEIEGVDLQQE